MSLRRSSAVVFVTALIVSHEFASAFVPSTQPMTKLGRTPMPAAGWQRSGFHSTSKENPVPLAASLGVMPEFDDFLTDASVVDRMSSLSITDGAIGDLSPAVIIPAVFLLGAVSAFVFANVVYTPEILEAAEQQKLEVREKEITKLLQVVVDHVAAGNDLKELKQPLEVALNMPLQDYIRQVKEYRKEAFAETYDPSSRFYAESDARLVAVLEANGLSGQKDE